MSRGIIFPDGMKKQLRRSEKCDVQRATYEDTVLLRHNILSLHAYENSTVAYAVKKKKEKSRRADNALTSAARGPPSDGGNAFYAAAWVRSDRAPPHAVRQSDRRFSDSSLCVGYETLLA